MHAPRWRSLIAFLILALVGPSAVVANVRPRFDGQEFRFVYDDSRIYVPVRIGGGSSRWFILDTGASGTIVDLSVAEDAGLAVSGGETVRGAGAGSAQQATTSALSLSVGGIPLQVHEPLVMNLARLLGPTSGRAPAGIIGSQFFREHFVGIDFARRRITVRPPQINRRGDYEASVPLTFNEGVPLADVRLLLPTGRGVTANALVDLGAKSTFLIPEPFIEREKLRDAFRQSIIAGLGAGIGGDTYYEFAKAVRLGFAVVPTAFVDWPITGLSVRGTLRSTWHQGLLGADFLSRFRLAFDYGHNRLLLTRRASLAEPFDRSGLTLRATGDGLRTIIVREVFKGGPGDTAGILQGDELVVIDGTPAPHLGLGAIRSRLRNRGTARIALTLQRGRDRRHIILRLRDLL